jgi:Spy/CpxP family protein refolding chaperone
MTRILKMPAKQPTPILARVAGAACFLLAASAHTAVVAAPNAPTSAPTPAQCEAVNNRSLYAFAGVALTRRQEAAYRAINADVAKRLVPIYAAGVSTPMDSGMAIITKVVGPESDKKIVALNARRDDLVRNGMSEDAQITALRAEFGADFIIERPQTLVYTSQQVTQSDVLVNEFTRRMAASLTPRQRATFVRNSQDLRTHDLCNSPGQTFNMPLYLWGGPV